MSIPNNPHQLPRRQRGAALVTGLLIMIIMTLIGITAMESSIIQTNLATNTQLDAIGFQTTEATLAQANNDGVLLTQAMNSGVGNNPGETFYLQQNITLNKQTGGAVLVVPSVLPSLCGSLPGTQIQGQGLNNTQSTTNTTSTRYAFSLIATTDVGGQANTQHTLISSLPVPNQQGLPGGGGIILCPI